MPNFYVVKDIGGGFDGLVVEGHEDQYNPNCIQVEKIIDRGSTIGDRNVSLQIPPGSILISKTHLDEIEDPGTREFATDNPFGKMILEGHMEVGGLKVSYSQFEKGLSVVVTDVGSNKNLFTSYFLKDIEKVKSAIEGVLKENEGDDPEDLVFKLRAMKEAEVNG